MHPALKTPDIVREIFTHLTPVVHPYSEVPAHLPDNDEFFSIDRRTLFNSALACKAFVGPSLDVLWSAMDELVPLFQLIPRIQRTEDGLLNFQGVVSKDDLAIFNNYAQRVRIYVQEEEIPDSTYIQIVRMNQRTTILPNLRVLIVPGTCHLRSELPFFFTRNLRTVRFHEWDMTDTTFSSLLTTLALCAAGTETLVSDDAQIPEDSWPCISQLHALNRLLIPNGLHVDRDFVTQFPFMQRLVELRIASITFELPIEAPAPHHSFFPCLKILHVSSKTTIFQVTNLLSADPFPQLESLQFEVEQVNPYAKSDEHEWLDLFRLLVANNSRSLRRLHITATVTDLDNWTHPGIDITTAFSRLFHLNLTQLCLQFPLFKTITAADLQLITHSWPMLNHLELATRYKTPIKAVKLVSIAQALPHLKILGIGLDGRFVRSLDDVPILSHRLEWLILTNSCPWSIRLFARRVDRLFPYVQVLSGDGERALEKDIFDKLKECISTSQAARKDERVRMGLVKV